MVTTKYYIEDLATGKCLQSIGEADAWKQFEPASTYTDANGQTVNILNTAREFANEAAALSHIDTLPNGEYKIFTRIVKS